MFTRTGLLSTTCKQSHDTHHQKKPSIQLITIAKPAPYIRRPLEGIYSPYSGGCSFLCNHPTDHNTKELLKTVRNFRDSGNKRMVLLEQAKALQLSLDRLKVCSDYVENVPEELFRKYTETDSRPLTPAPTLVSVHTRASGSRRCVTPEHFPPTEAKPKTKLILDLRRSHSQETLSWYSINLQHPEINHAKHNQINGTVAAKEQTKRMKTVTKTTARNEPLIIMGADVEAATVDVLEAEIRVESEQFDHDDVIRRRGRQRRRKRRNISKEPTVVYQASLDPETQIATDPEVRNQNAHSLNPNEQQESDKKADVADKSEKIGLRRHSSLDIGSYLDVEILKCLRRELNEETIDREFNLKRRKALEEALKTIRPNKIDCTELDQMKNDLRAPVINWDLFLSLPKIFDRSSARFELPMDSRELTKLTPLEYLQQYVFVSDSRHLLYNCIFNRHQDPIVNERGLAANKLNAALSEVMGKPLRKNDTIKLNYFIELDENWMLNFRTFCGIAALCERLFAPEFSTNVVSKKENQCEQIEIIDFRSLEKRLSGQRPDERLLNMLIAIKQSQTGVVCNRDNDVTMQMVK